MFRKILLLGLLLPSRAWAMDDGGPKKRSYGEMSAVPDEREIELRVDDNGLIIGPAAVATAVESRPFRCGVVGCGKTFIRRHNLSLHKRVHIGKRYACDVAGCVSSFTRNYDLGRHKRRTHKIDVPV